MFFFVVTLLVLAIYYYSTRNHDYWAKRNVKYVSPIPLFGNQFKNVTGMENNTQITSELYNRFPEEKVVGYYRGVTPELIVRDVDIVRDILSVDFNYFYKRGVVNDNNIKQDTLSRTLFHVEGDTWKLLRQRLTPAFTTAKLKNMFPLIIQCAERLQQVGEDIAARGGECDVRDLMARFTTDFIGACGFGIEMNSINDENSLFRQLGKNVIKGSVLNNIIIFMREVFPELGSITKINRDVEETLSEIVQNVREQREYKPSGRNDFIDLLLELEGKGIIEGESIEKTNSDGTPASAKMQMDFQLMVAQVFLFFVAGFETSSSATSHTLYQLALHPDIQKKVHDEIDEVLLKYEGKLCYDSVAEMKFLDMVLKESLRLFPSLGVLNRECAKQYTIPKLGIVLDPGVKIIIPIKAIQLDPQYFDNPTEFRPERFLSDEANGRHNYVYLPFGEGPRNCIGARLGKMQSLAGLAAVLQKFTVKPCAATRPELKCDPRINTLQVVEGGIPLKLALRKS